MFVKSLVYYRFFQSTKSEKSTNGQLVLDTRKGDIQRLRRDGNCLGKSNSHFNRGCRNTSRTLVYKSTFGFNVFSIYQGFKKDIFKVYLNICKKRYGLNSRIEKSRKKILVILQKKSLARKELFVLTKLYFGYK